MSVGLARDVYYAYKGGSSLRQATITRASTGTRRDRLGVLGSFATNLPRLHWVDPDGDGIFEEPRLLMEGARTNVCLRSEEIDNNTSWASVNTPGITANDATAPDGATTADRINDDDAGLFEGRQQDITVTDDSTAWTTSVFVQAGTSPSIIGVLMQFTGGTGVNYNMHVDAEAGTAAAETGSSPTDVGIEAWGDGWFRAWVTGSNNGTGNTGLRVVLEPARAATLGGSASTAETGDALFWGVQVENAASMSAYIATTGTSASRSADQIDDPAIIPFHKSWSLYVSGYLQHGRVSSPGWFVDLLMLRDSDGTDRILLSRVDVSANIRTSWQSPSGDGLIQTPFTPPAGNPIEILLRHDASDNHLEIGLDGGTFAIGSAPTSQTKPFTQGATVVRYRDDGFWEVQKVKILAGLLSWAEIRTAPTAVGQ